MIRYYVVYGKCLKNATVILDHDYTNKGKEQIDKVKALVKSFNGIDEPVFMIDELGKIINSLFKEIRVPRSKVKHVTNLVINGKRITSLDI